MSYTPQGHTQQETSGQDSKTYRYNAAERLITYESSDGTLAHYRYDPFGRRVSKSVTKDAATQVTYFVYSEQALMGSWTRMASCSEPMGSIRLRVKKGCGARIRFGRRRR
ncbi:RHS repeat domain-containing protein [Comamonas sp. JC664]|uniref:RHS repeat domain-containing protein n=1 Tax=Comamonas sp. JC664 TaxID=2801917 RepID=UPI003611D96B